MREEFLLERRPQPPLVHTFEREAVRVRDLQEDLSPQGKNANKIRTKLLTQEEKVLMTQDPFRVSKQRTPKNLLSKI